MDNHRAYMIMQIELAMTAAKKAGDPMVEFLLEQALREAKSVEGKRLPKTLGNVEQDNEPEL